MSCFDRRGFAKIQETGTTGQFLNRSHFEQHKSDLTFSNNTQKTSGVTTYHQVMHDHKITTEMAI